MIEEWRDIVSYEGLYQVSNIGRVRSLDKKFFNKRYGFGLRKGRVLSNKLGSSGYYSIHLTKNGKRKCYLVHRLVAMSFVLGYSHNLDVNHKDMDKLNNLADNLEWVTRSENCNHAIKNGHKPNLRGEMIGSSKLKENEVLLIRDLYKTKKYLYKNLSSQFGISKSTIGYIINKKIWSHV